MSVPPVPLQSPEAQPAAGLLCPVCRVDLVMADRAGVEIDYCPKCRGVWLDRGELDKSIEMSLRQPAGPDASTRPSSDRDGGYAFRAEAASHLKHAEAELLDATGIRLHELHRLRRALPMRGRGSAWLRAR